MNLSLSTDNLRRVGLHVVFAAAAAAVAAVGLDLSHVNNPAVVTLAALVCTPLASFFRGQSDAAEAGQPVQSFEDDLAALQRLIAARVTINNGINLLLGVAQSPAPVITGETAMAEPAVEGQN